MKTKYVKFERCQLGWLCKIYFSFSSSRQFTDEHHLVEVARRWWILSFFAARWEARFHIRVHGARRGEREAKGWSA